LIQNFLVIVEHSHLGIYTRNKMFTITIPLLNFTKPAGDTNILLTILYNLFYFFFFFHSFPSFFFPFSFNFSFCCQDSILDITMWLDSLVSFPLSPQLELNHITQLNYPRSIDKRHIFSRQWWFRVLLFNKK